MSPRCLFGDLNSSQLFWPQWQRLCELEGTSGGQTSLLMVLSTTVLKTPQTLDSFFGQLLPMLKPCYDVKVLPYTQSEPLFVLIHACCLSSKSHSEKTASIFWMTFSEALEDDVHAPQNHLFSSPNNPISLSFCSQNKCSIHQPL